MRVQYYLNFSSVKIITRKFTLKLYQNLLHNLNFFSQFTCQPKWQTNIPLTTILKCSIEWIIKVNKCVNVGKYSVTLGEPFLGSLSKDFRK